MNIIEAAKALKEGKKVRRSFWRDENYMYQWDTSNFPQAHTEIGVLSRALVMDELLADDWEVIEEKSAMDMAFEKAVRKEAGCFGIIQQDSFNKGWKAHEDHIKEQSK